jgi:hypothetical protein
VVDDLFVALGIDKGEYLHEVEGGDSSATTKNVCCIIMNQYSITATLPVRL